MKEERDLRRKFKGFWVIALLINMIVIAWAENPSVGSSPGQMGNEKELFEKRPADLKRAAGNEAEVLSAIPGIIAEKHGVPANLVYSIIQAESNGDVNAVSPKGAMGLMQLMPETAREYQVFNPFDPAANINGGVRYLKDLLNEFSWDLSLALAAYNAGPGAVKKYRGVPPFPETQEFVRKVQDRYLSGAPISGNPVFAAKIQENSLLDKGSGKVIISGSPREVAAFLKFMKKDKWEVLNQ